MISREEALASMLTFTGLRRKASQLRGAMDSIKEDLAQYMTEHPDEPLDRGDGCAAKWTSKQNRVINAAPLPEDLLCAAAEAGLLSVGIEKVTDLPDGQLKSALLAHVTVVPGEPFIDISSPTWGAEKAAKSVAKEVAARPAPAAPTPIQKPRESAPKPAQQPQQGGAEWTCPVHPDRQPNESKWGGTYCSGKDENDEYCKWTSRKKAS